MRGEVVITASVQSVNCPECEADIEGWVGDPRGAPEVECEVCGHVFSIPEDARVVL
jgi:rubredoxin